MPIPQNGGHAREKVLDGRVHLGHTHNVGDGALSSDDTTECVRVLFTKLLEEHETKRAQLLVLAALLYNNGEAGGQICGLLPDLCALVVETPKDGGDNLSEIRLDSDTCKSKWNG